jgi:hypothetical protein
VTSGVNGCCAWFIVYKQYYVSTHHVNMYIPRTCMTDACSWTMLRNIPIRTISATSLLLLILIKNFNWIQTNTWNTECYLNFESIYLCRIPTTGILGQYLVLVVTCHAVGSAYLYNYLSLVTFPRIVGKCDTIQRNGQYTFITDPTACSYRTGTTVAY